MLILEVESAILRNLLERSLDPNETLSGEYIFCDFDGVRYRVNFLMAGHGREKRPGGVTIEIMIGCWDQLKEFGAQETFDRLYGQYAVPPTADKGITWTLGIKFDLQPLAEAERKALVTLACRLKANLLGAPILWVAEQFANKSNFAPFEIPYRGSTGESFFVTPTDQGASVTFRIRFSDPGDKVIGAVFFQELGGDVVRRKIPAVPVVKYSETATGDLASFPAPGGDPKLYGYLTIVLQARQLSAAKKGETADLVPMFRNYVHYHIKCAKAFLHQKMRARTADLLAKLAQATPEPKQKIRRTITGKIMGPK
jgi:actin related protein 2/3 complex subunit 2